MSAQSAPDTWSLPPPVGGGHHRKGRENPRRQPGLKSFQLGGVALRALSPFERDFLRRPEFLAPVQPGTRCSGLEALILVMAAINIINLFGTGETDSLKVEIALRNKLKRPA
jgi:hypothetical protein